MGSEIFSTGLVPSALQPAQEDPGRHGPILVRSLLAIRFVPYLEIEVRL
jgi:hypothetical protein